MKHRKKKRYYDIDAINGVVGAMTIGHCLLWLLVAVN